MKRRGICYTLAGENISENNYPTTSPPRLFNGWMSSSGHRALILQAGSTVGVGAFKGNGSNYRSITGRPCSPQLLGATPREADAGPTRKPTVRHARRRIRRPDTEADPSQLEADGSHDRATDAGPDARRHRSHAGDHARAEPPAGSPGGNDYPIWLDGIVLEGFDDGMNPTGDFDPAATPAPPPSPDGSDTPATEPPDTGGTVTDSDGGSLQVIEPPSQLGLLDTIVGGVVSSYLGK